MPGIPETLQEMEELLQSPMWQAWAQDLKGNSFFRETVVADDGSICAVWVSQRLQELLTKDNWEAHADATFDSTPSKPACEQMFTIHAYEEDGHGQRKQVILRLL